MSDEEQCNKDVTLTKNDNKDVTFYLCTFCNYRCSDASNLKKHVRTHSGEKPYSCDNCDLKFCDPSNLKKHINKKHPEENSSRYIITENTGRTNPDETLESNVEYKKFCCNECNYACDREQDLKRHNTRVHTTSYSCNICDYTCFRTSNLKKHMNKKHPKDKPLASKHDANTEITENTALKNPEDTPKSDLDYKKLRCNLCDYTCARELDLRRHTRVHTGEKPYKCNLCAYKTLDKGNLTKHNRRHTGDLPYSCTRCDYICRDSSNMKKHLRTHTGEKPYICRLCDFKSACPANLRAHQKTHNGERKRYSCEKCNYQSLRSIDVKRHAARRHKEKLFACDLCDFKCPEEVDLREHAESHIDDFICNICYYNANTADELKMHVNIHMVGDSSIPDGLILSDLNNTSEDAQYTCNLCEYKCVVANDLKTHLQTHAEQYLKNFKHFLDI